METLDRPHCLIYSSECHLNSILVLDEVEELKTYLFVKLILLVDEGMDKVCLHLPDSEKWCLEQDDTSGCAR